MNICLLGNNLTNLVLANILLKKNINIDIISQSPKTVFKNTIRTIAISNENYKFLNLLNDIKVPIKKVAIELNQEILDKKKLSKIKLKNNDKIEIVHFIGGG